MTKTHSLPMFVVAASLVANFLASENITGLAGVVACERALPAILFDPLGAALSLAALGFVLTPFTGRYTSFSQVIVDRYGVVVGGLASALSLVGSLLWAGAQYKAVLELVGSIGVVPHGAVEPTVMVCLLSWTLIGGLVADVWLDSLSMAVVTPCIGAIAIIAATQTPARAFEAEMAQAKAVLPSKSAANMMAAGMLGNLFTEELAGRVLLASSPSSARTACLMAAIVFAIIGLAPAAVGIWAGSEVGVLHGDHGKSLCKDGQDQIISLALARLVPTRLRGAEHALGFVLIIESLNTVDTSILMCANVLAGQVGRVVPRIRDASWLSNGSVLLSMAFVVAASKAGDNVWELGEAATKAVGAPLGVLCLFVPFNFGDWRSAVVGACASQGIYTCLAGLRAAGESDAGGMPFLWAVVGGALAYCVVASALPRS